MNSFIFNSEMMENRFDKRVKHFKDGDKFFDTLLIKKWGLISLLLNLDHS